MKKRMAVWSLCLAFLLTACSGKAGISTGKERGMQDTVSIEKPMIWESVYSADAEMENNLKLYKEILDLYYQALYAHQMHPQQWQPDNYCTENDLIPAIVNPYWSWEDTNDILSKEGFAFLDLNGDGVDELVMGWEGNDIWNMDEGYVFAVYTVVDGAVTFALEGWERCKYVIGEDGYLYNNGISSWIDTTYTKYRFQPDQEGFLEPVEELRTCRNEDGDYWWEHLTDPEAIKAMEAAGKQKGLFIDEEEAFAIGEGWMESGVSMDCTPFSEYIFLRKFL